MFVQNDVWLMFVLFWLFGMAMSSFTCCVSVFLQTSQSASNAGLGIVLVSDWRQAGAKRCFHDIYEGRTTRTRQSTTLLYLQAKVVAKHSAVHGPESP
jgi:hypothetical protein